MKVGSCCFAVLLTDISKANRKEQCLLGVAAFEIALHNSHFIHCIESIHCFPRSEEVRSRLHVHFWVQN